MIESGLAFNVRKTDENEFSYTCVNRRSEEILHKTNVGLWQESLRKRREENPGEVNNTINTNADVLERLWLTEIRAPHFYIGMANSVEG
jgi:hypothetical protein